MIQLEQPEACFRKTSDLLAGAISTQSRIYSTILADPTFVAKVARATAEIQRCLRNGHVLYFAGNGGSAAMASHFMAELVGRYRRERPGFRAISLCSDSALLTALANDFPISELFSRQLSALARKGDVLICLTTSGRSPNILNALKAAEELGISAVTLCGSHTGDVDNYGHVISVTSADTPRIQEVHGLLLHVIAEAVEDALLG